MENVGDGLLIGPKTWDRIMEIFWTFGTVRECPETDVGCSMGIYALNSILVFMRPVMGKKFGSKK